MEKTPQQKKSSRKPVWIFSFASCLNDLGAEIIHPIWPLFVTTVLKAPFTVLGILDGFAETMVSLSQVFSGYLSDRIKKRKIFIWLGYLGGSLGRIGYTVASHWWQLFPFRFIDRMGKMRDAPRDAIVADLSTRNSRGASFGIIEAFDSLGAIFGVVISILLFKHLGFRPLFFLAAIPSLISVFLVFVFVKDIPNSHIFNGLKWGSLGKDFRLFLLSNIFFSLSFFSYSFLLLYLKEVNFSLPSIPVFYLVFTIFASLFSWPAGKLADKLSRKFVTGIAFALWGLTTIGFIFSSHNLGYFVAFILFAFYGIHKAALKPAQNAFVSEFALPESKASVLGLFKMVTGLCALPASFMAGFLWDSFGREAPFYFSLVMAAAALLILFFVKEQQKAETA